MNFIITNKKEKENRKNLFTNRVPLPTQSESLHKKPNAIVAFHPSSFLPSVYYSLLARINLIRLFLFVFFREHNIIEYKSPDDYLGINDFYKAYGYVCFYQSDTEEEGQINPEELTS